MVRVLQENDVYDWSPRVPTLLINLEGDTVVDPKNSTVAFNAMRNRGAGRDLLRRSIIRDAKLNHLNAIAAAMSRARAFFDGGFNNVRDAQ